MNLFIYFFLDKCHCVFTSMLCSAMASPAPVLTDAQLSSSSPCLLLNVKASSQRLRASSNKSIPEDTRTHTHTTHSLNSHLQSSILKQGSMIIARKYNRPNRSLNCSFSLLQNPERWRSLFTHKIQVFRCGDRCVDHTADISFPDSVPAGGFVCAGAAAGWVHASHLQTRSRSWLTSTERSISPQP